MDRLLRRLAFLAEIADRRHSSKSSARLGKTAMQKLLFLLQEGLGVDVGYQFSLYTYGPYDANIMGDLDYASALGVLKLIYDPEEGYDILPGPESDTLREEQEAIRNEAGESIDRLFSLFGTQTARQLELRSTMLYVAAEEPDMKRDVILERVRALKPKYDEKELLDAFDELDKVRFLRRPR